MPLSRTIEGVRKLLKSRETGLSGEFPRRLVFLKSGLCRGILSVYALLGKLLDHWKHDEGGQGVSEYAVLVALIVLVVVTAVHAIGMSAQQVINRVNEVFHPDN